MNIVPSKVQKEFFAKLTRTMTANAPAEIDELDELLGLLDEEEEKEQKEQQAADQKS